MMWLDILPAIAGLLSIMMGVVVLVNGTNKKGTKWPFALFAIITGIWALFICRVSF